MPRGSFSTFSSLSELISLIQRLVSTISSSRRQNAFFIFANYSSLLINFVSGIVLARALGPELRGNFALIASYCLLVYSLSSFNISSGTLQARFITNSQIADSRAKLLKLPILIGLVLTPVLSSVILVFLWNNPSLQKYFLEFAIVCFGSFVGAVTVFTNSVLVTNGMISRLSINRFLGLSCFSVSVVFLYLFDLITIEKLLLAQLLSNFLIAVIAIFLYLQPSEIRLPDPRDVLKLSIKGLPRFVFEYSIPVLSYSYISSTHGAMTLGVFVIAWGWTSLVDALYPIAESRTYKLLHTQPGVKIILQGLKARTGEIVLFGLIIMPTCFFIPFIFGKDYQSGVQLALMLIVLKIITQVTNLLETILMFNRQISKLLIQTVLWVIIFVLCWTTLDFLSWKMLLLPYFCAQGIRLLTAFWYSRNLLLS